MQPKDPQKALERKKRKILRRLQKALDQAELTQDEKRELSEWEDEFLHTVQERLDEFDRAFHDPDKGRLDEALSYLQTVKLKEIEDKLKGKTRKAFAPGKGLRARKPLNRMSKKKQAKTGWKPRPRDEDPEAAEPDIPQPESHAPESPAPEPPTTKPAGDEAKRPFLRVIKGGK